MTEEEFDKAILRGEKLWILDDMVLDLTDFMPNHPGGVFVLDQNIGRDISKFFYGGYQLDGNGGKPGSSTTAYAHSNIARKIANQYAVAALARIQTPTGRYEIIPEQIHKMNNSTSTFVFGQVDTTSNNDKFKMFSGDVTQIGKHFLFYSLGTNGVPIIARNRVLRRHYTTTNALRKPVYDALLECIRTG